MASRTAELLELRAEKWAVNGHYLECGAFVRFESGGRRYRLPLPSVLKPRNRNARERMVTMITQGNDRYTAKAVFKDGGRATLLASLAADYDLTAFIEAGEALPNPPPERSGPAEVVKECATLDRSSDSEPDAALVTLTFDGDELEVIQVEGLGWVSLPSLLAPFGKDVDNTRPLLDGWARVRVERLRSRNGVTRGVTLLHIEDAPLLVARLDGRGMSEEVKAKHARYLRHIARVLAEHFGLRPATPAPAAPNDPWTILRAVADGTLQLQADVKAANEQSKAAHARAEQAVDMAQRAITLAGSKSVLDAIAESTPPGASSDTPDGSWSARPPEGYLSQRSVARQYALPSEGTGSNFVGQVARALGVYEDVEATSAQAVVIGGRTRREHITYGPQALARLEKPLRFAHARMTACGYHVLHGVMQPRGGGVVRGKAFVLHEMLAAATAAASGVRAVDSPQTSLPGVDQRAS